VPTAPPLPFTYSGRMESSEGVVVYLTAGERLIRARAGDLIDQTYRVERIDASTVYLRYLPLDTPQNLAAGK
jgi:Tfp pilus assembly protein PilP